MRNIIINYILLFYSILAIISCNDSKPLQKNSQIQSEKVDITGGEQLSKQYCGGCHLYPEPLLLDKTSWEKYVLPRMGIFFGIYANKEMRDLQFNEPYNFQKERLLANNLFPEKSTIDTNDWNLIKAFYINSAPTLLPELERDTIILSLGQFEYIVPNLRIYPPSTTIIQFTDDGYIAVGDDNNKQLLLVEPEKGNLIAKGKVGNGPVNIIESKSSYIVTTMGSFSPTDKPNGSIVMLPKDKSNPSILIEELIRPVHTDFSDVNKDGIPDLVISEFGKWLGRLSFFESSSKGYIRKYVKDKTGPIRAYFVDIDSDKTDEIVALFGQGDEGIWAYKKQGERWEERELLRFPPSWGSSYFALQDINGDNHLDIIYTCGDNADFGPVIRPYHGIRIYQNDGNWNFKEVLFIPHNGVYKAVVNDFDKDGDMDIAAISFFPDYLRHPDEAFIYYENIGQSFVQQTFKDYTIGRWITMDVADYNKDGYLDIVLGSIAFEAPYLKGFAENIAKVGIPYILLKNRGKEAGTPFQKNILE